MGDPQDTFYIGVEQSAVLEAAANDTELKLDALGMLTHLVYLLSGRLGQPVHLSIEGLMYQHGNGKESTARMLRDLETRGYLVRKRVAQKGRVSGSWWTIQQPPAN